MKVTKRLLAPALACALGLFTTVAARADMQHTERTTTTEKTTTYRGTVTEVDPASSTIVLRSESSSAPTRYTYNEKTVFTDAQGNVVAYEAIKDSPVTIQYTREGDRTIVTKVTKEPTTVRKETTTTTTTTTDDE